MAYVLQASGRHQLALVLLSILVFLLSAVPLEIQRRVVNSAIAQGDLGAITFLALAYFGIALLQGGIKLGLNIYRAWVSESGVLQLRRAVTALRVVAPGHGARPQHAEGTEVAMVLSEVEPIGGFLGISLSEPLLQTGILVSVFGYLAWLQSVVAALCAAAFIPQMVFVPLMQRAINQRAGERVRALREVGGDIVEGRDDVAPTDAAKAARIGHVYQLGMGMFRIKFSMYFLMNLLHHLGVATALGVGGFYVVRGQLDVGTVVAFVSGLARVNDPWGDLVDWYREMTQVRTRYQLLKQAMDDLRNG